ncbi:hypothetical protein PHYC_03207 [Phycisphaerales bacterium]|nr:hypothetical protein PHYC_03207 [Phycisphaerales bacterium]
MSLTRPAKFAVALALAALAGSALAQTATVPVSSPPMRVRASSSPQRDTLVKVMRPVAIEFTETRLEDVMRYLQEITQADIDVYWMDDRNTIGLDKETLVSLKVERATALSVLEKVLEKATGDATGTGGCSWQMSETGTLQVGPKERLNKYKRVEIYNVQDLLLEVPNYTDAPEFDLQSVLQSTGQQGGGGGQSPFRETGGQGAGGLGTRPYQERLDELVVLLTSLVEPEQWVDNGGDGASLRPFQGNLIVNAPDYVHRQLNGYPYWPSSATRVASTGGRRYVTIGLDTSLAKIVGFENTAVTAVAGGRLISSDPNANPGGNQAPADKSKDPKKDTKKDEPKKDDKK